MTFPDWRGQSSQSGSVHTALAVEVLLTGNEIFSFVAVQLQFSKTTTKRELRANLMFFAEVAGDAFRVRGGLVSRTEVVHLISERVFP